MNGLPGLGPQPGMPAAAGLQGLAAMNPALSVSGLFQGGDPYTSMQLANYFTSPKTNPAIIPPAQPPAPMVNQFGAPAGAPPVLPTQGASGKTFDLKKVAPGLGPAGGQQFAQPIKPTYFGM